MHKKTSRVSFSTHSLFEIAKEAHLRAVETERAGKYSHDAIVAIVFSCSAFEALVAQLVFHAEQWSHINPQLKLMSDVLGGLEESSIKAKIAMIYWIFCGTACDFGTQPLQDFALLIKIRNQLVHLKPDMHNLQETENLLAQLKGKGLAPTYNAGKLRGVWTMYISNSSVSRWAYNTIGFVKENIFQHTSDQKLKDFLGPFGGFGVFTPIK